MKISFIFLWFAIVMFPWLSLWDSTNCLVVGIMCRNKRYTPWGDVCVCIDRVRVTRLLLFPFQLSGNYIEYGFFALV